MMNNSRETPTVSPLDKVDFAIIEALEGDGRQSTRSIAATLGVSQPTVARRMQKLMDTGVIKIAASTDGRALGFGTMSLIGLNITPGESDKVLSRVEPFRSVKTIMLTVGRYDLLLFLMTRNQNELACLADEIGAIPDVAAAEVISVMSLKKWSWKRWGSPTQELRLATPRDLEASELKLLRELELNPRESIINLSRKIGLSSTSTRRKLESLISERIIRIVSIANTRALGFNTEAITFVKVKPGQVMSLANSLVKETRVRVIGITTGAFQLCLLSVFRDTEDMAHFLRNELGTMPSVVKHETMIQVGAPKFSLTFLSETEGTKPNLQ